MCQGAVIDKTVARIDILDGRGPQGKAEMRKADLPSRGFGAARRRESRVRTSQQRLIFPWAGGVEGRMKNAEAAIWGHLLAATIKSRLGSTPALGVAIRRPASLNSQPLSATASRW